jgi:2-keto-3-deoxy-L-rhamnonate aldolase RhmA
MTLSFPDRLRRREPVTGTMLRLIREPGVTAICRSAGFDLIMLDMEHGSFGFDDVGRLAQAGRGEGLAVMVRVPELTKGYVSRALDCGVDGVMVPMLETPQQARQLAAWAKYLPLGGRGLGSMGGHTRYRQPGPVVDFMNDANHRTFTLAQIETVAGVQNADAIAATPGIDALVIGPNDLANALGRPGEMTHPDQERAMAAIGDAAARHGKIFGMHAGTALLRTWAKRGMTLLLNAIDMQVLAEGMRELCHTTRQLADLPD